MRIFARPALALVPALLLACGGPPPAGEPDLGVDAATRQDLRAAPSDLLQGPGVRCGSEACPTPAQICCSGDNGRTGTCQAPGACPAKANYACDGRSDCAAGEVCCYAAATGASCQSAAACAAIAGAIHLCAAATDCESTELCCAMSPFMSGSVYKDCLTGGCPK